MVTNQLTRNIAQVFGSSDEASLKSIQKIINSLKQIVFTIDVNGYFVFVSNTAENVFGYTSDEMVGKLYTDFLVKEDVDKTVKAFKAIQKGELCDNFINHFTCNDGKVLTILWSAQWESTEKRIYCTAQVVMQPVKGKPVKANADKNAYAILDQVTDGFIIIDEN